MAATQPTAAASTSSSTASPSPVPSSAATTSSASAPAKEYIVRVVRDSRKKHCIMKFNAVNKVDFTQCGPVKIERENNVRSFKAAHDIDMMPKFGAGSEFGREQKEQARRKKYGMAIRKYNPYEQPWLLKVGSGKQAKKFKGSKEGGILENTSYFVFSQCSDGAFEACPVEEWYHFNPCIKYRFLNSEEAEEEFLRRDRNLNYRTLMLKKRLKGDDVDDDEDEEGGKKKHKGKKGKGFKLTEMDEWADMSNESEVDSEEGDDENGEKKKKPPKNDPKKKKKKSFKKANSDDEAIEESDDQNEGMEVDYMTSSDSDDDTMFDDKQRDQDKYEQQGVAEEKGLRSLIDSDAEDEEEEKKEEHPDEDEEEEEEGKKKKKEGVDSDSESSSSDSDSDPEKSSQSSALFMQKKSEKMAERKKGVKRRPSGSSEGSAATNSRSATPSADLEAKRVETSSPVLKKMRVETPTLPGASEGITEEAVRRYLMRKPMTTKDLLQKFKSKNTGLSKDKLVTTIAQILKRLNPEKQKIKDKLYLSIKKQ